MYELVLTRRRVLTGALLVGLVVLLGTRFLLHGPHASTALARPIVGSATAGATRKSKIGGTMWSACNSSGATSPASASAA